MGKELLEKQLREASEQLSSQVEFMENREKGEMNELLNIPVTIRDYDFLSGQDGEYVVFITDEVKDAFFFGGSILTDHIQTLEEKGLGDAIRECGLPVKFEKVKSKTSGRYYTNAILYPESEIKK